jgi:3-deoxy-7-phosphoheptulonate synthase
MIVVLKPEATADVVSELRARIEALGLRSLHLPGTERTVLGALGDERALAELDLSAHPMVESVQAVLTPYRSVTREFHPHDTIVQIGKVTVGGGRFTVAAGPPFAQPLQSLRDTTEQLPAAGAQVLRCGIIEPRKSPYTKISDPEVLGAQVHQAGKSSGLPVIIEVQTAEDVAQLAHWADAFEVRSIGNHRLLCALAAARKPVFLARGSAERLEDLLMAAEYLIAQGNPHIILCERGVRTFETVLPLALDIGALVWLKNRTHLPVFVDPSHSTGSRILTPAVALAALSAGADGISIYVHHTPEHAGTEGAAALDMAAFSQMIRSLRAVAKTLGREMSP